MERVSIFWNNEMAIARSHSLWSTYSALKLHKNSNSKYAKRAFNTSIWVIFQNQEFHKVILVFKKNQNQNFRHWNYIHNFFKNTSMGKIRPSIGQCWLIGFEAKMAVVARYLIFIALLKCYWWSNPACS